MKKLLLIALSLFSLSALADSRIGLPDPDLTPGATRQATLEEVCTPGTAKEARKVSESTKRKVYKSYGLPTTHSSYCATYFGCELDHLVPLSLGGSNSPKNLWPMPYVGEWNAHLKDALENRLHREVCSGKLDLEAAQQVFMHDWVAGYKAYIKQ